jgi:2,5-dioxopentanoate dehydrogenase
MTDLGDDLILRCMVETGLTRARLEAERARTVGQLQLFAEVVRQGSFLDVRIDRGLPERKPLPRPDLRLLKIPLGPVAVFGSSNFPLAFSVAGGDTASALAAGCPVIAKAHSAHPGTSELVGRAVLAAAKATGMPDGVFSLLFDRGITIGQSLVADRRIRAVGFTGSRRGGTALMAIAATRAEPIPVYAEMSSINPVFLLPDALRQRASAIAKDFVAALTLGAGQFCTNPGLVIAIADQALDDFIKAAAALITTTPAATMLTPGIFAAYQTGVAAVAQHDAVEQVASGLEGGLFQGRVNLFVASADAFLAHRELQDEIFGATSLVVRCRDADQMVAVADALEGQLTAALHVAAADHSLTRRLLPRIERKVGRILIGSFGTGVEVAHAMVHGGPYPATSDGRSTSVGTLAIDRFLRPLCYQDLPEALLPDALKDTNLVGLARRVDGAIVMPDA